MKKMKSLISGILLAALVALCLAGLPALRLEAKAVTVLSGTCGDNVTWTLDDAGTLTISGYGAIKDSSTTPWYGQHEAIKSVVIQEGVTAIGDSAFSGCTALASVSIPASVKSIGKYAFQGCAALASVIIPEGVESIGRSAFSGCTALTHVTVPNSVNAIGRYAFMQCPNLQYNTYDNAQYLGNSENPYLALANTVSDSITSCTIHPKAKLICPDAFNYCKNLTSITVPENIEVIGGDAFIGCSSLESITLPFVGDSRKTSLDTYQYALGYVFGSSSYTGCIPTTQEQRPYSTTYYIPTSLKSVTVTGGNILYGAFSGCSHITSVTLPENLSAIEKSAFIGCSGLTSITLPATVESIGDTAFARCTALKNIYFDGSAPEIGANAFQNVTATAYYKADATWTEAVMQNYGGDITWVARELAYTLSADGTYYIVSGIGTCTDTDLVIPATYKDLPVKEIGASAFRDNTAITSVTIPEGVKTIGNYAFSGCTGLTSLTLPNSLQIIGQSAFYKCSGLASVSIPNNVESIGYHAFYNCPKLTYTVYDNAKYLGNAENPYLVLVQATSEAISSCAVHPDTRILYSEAFFCCAQLTELTVPKGVVEVSPYLFDASGVKKVFFDGSAPSFAKNAFSGVSAAAYYYPDSSWTGEVMQNYGGAITWTPMGSDVKLSVTSFGAASDAVTVQLIPSGETEAAYTLTTADSPANSGVWTLSGVKPGAYTVTLSKKNHVTRTYTLTVEDAEASLEAQLWLLGDVTGDGLVNFSDYSKVLSQAKNPNAGALEGYALACADVTADGMVNFSDYAKVLSQAKGNPALW